MKVLLTKKFADSDIAYLEARLDDGITLCKPDEYTEAGVLSEVDSVDVLLGGMLTDAIIERSAHLKFAQIPWTGVNGLNFSLMKQYGLTVCNSHSNAGVVAEHAISLWLSLAKKIPYHDTQMRVGNWNRISKSGNDVSPFSAGVSNSKVTFVGYGAISRSIHRMLIGFDPVVSAVTYSGVVKDTDDPVSPYKTNELDKAVSKADVVFICVPLTESTVGLVDQSIFDAMPEHSLLINVSRGEIVSEDALYRSLSGGLIGGAAIDTWYKNPKPDAPVNYPSESHEFHRLNNIVMSPHRAGYIDSGFPHLDDAIENINRANRGNPLKNIVSLTDNY